MARWVTTGWAITAGVVLAGTGFSAREEAGPFKQLLLQGRQVPFERPVYHMRLQGTTKECMRHGDWKLVRDQAGTPFELYNIKNDPCEKNNLAEQEPKRLNEMIRVLEAHMSAARRVPWKRPTGVTRDDPH